MDATLAQGLAFAAVVLLVLSADWTYRRVRDEPTDANVGVSPLFFVWFDAPIRFFGSLAQPYVDAVSPRKIMRIKQELITAALGGQLDVKQIIGAQAFAGFIIGVSAFLGTMLADATLPWVVLAVGVGVFIGWTYPGVWLTKRSENRKLAIAKQLPYALDLLTTAIEAGQDFNAALRYLTRHGLTGPLAEELMTTLGEIDLGQSRQQALRKFAHRIPCDELAQLVSALIQSMETGSSLSGTLRMLSQDLRRLRFHRAERQAARAPSLMIIPMVLFIVPGIFIIVFTPVILRVMQAMGRM